MDKLLRMLFLSPDGLGSTNFAEPDDDGEPEIVILGPGEEPPAEEDEGKASEPKKISMTPEEFRKLQESGDSAKAVREGISALAERLNVPREQVAANMQASPGESAEDVAKRVYEGLWNPDKALSSLNEVIDRRVGPIVKEQAKTVANLSKRILRNDPERGTYFKKYEAEIDAKVKGLPEHQQVLDGVYDWAYDQVLANHREDLVKSEVERQVAEALKAHGIDPNAKAKVDNSDFVEGSAVAPPRKKRVIVTQSDKDMAMLQNLSIEDYLLQEGRI